MTYVLVAGRGFFNFGLLLFLLLLLLDECIVLLKRSDSAEGVQRDADLSILIEQLINDEAIILEPGVQKGFLRGRPTGWVRREHAKEEVAALRAHVSQIVPDLREVASSIELDDLCWGLGIKEVEACHEVEEY